MKCDCNRGIADGKVCEKCEGTTFVVEQEEKPKRSIISRVSLKKPKK